MIDNTNLLQILYAYKKRAKEISDGYVDDVKRSRDLHTLGVYENSESMADDGRSTIKPKVVRAAVNKLNRVTMNSFKRPFSVWMVQAYDKTQREVQEELIINKQLTYFNGGLKKLKEINHKGIKEGVVFLRVGMKFVYNKEIKQATTNGYKKVLETKHPTFDIVEPENLYVPYGAEKVSEAPYVIHKIVMSRSELRKMDKKYNPEYGIYTDTDEIKGISINTDDTPNSKVDSFSYLNGREDANEQVELYEFWGDLDIDEDGISEPVVITFTDELIHRRDSNPFPKGIKPFVSWTPEFDIIQNTPFGLSMPMVLEDQQAIESFFKRSIVDHSADSVKSSMVTIKGMVDSVGMSQLMSKEPDQVIEVNAAPNTRISDILQPLVPAPLTPALGDLMNMNEQDKQSATGMSSYSLGTNSNPYKKAATVHAETESGDDTVIAYVGSFCNFIEELGRLFICLNNKYLNISDRVKLLPNEEVPIATPLDDMKIWVEANNTIYTAAQQQKYMMVMQNMEAIQSKVPEDVVIEILAHTFESVGAIRLADKLFEYKPHEDPIKQREAALAYEAAHADILHKQAQAERLHGQNQIGFKAVELDDKRDSNRNVIEANKLILQHEQHKDNVELKEHELELGLADRSLKHLELDDKRQHNADSNAVKLASSLFGGKHAAQQSTQAR